MICASCDAPLPKGRMRCGNPKCKAWNIAHESGEEATVLLSDARLLEVQRFQTGLVDEAFGGGIARTSVALLGGDPGAGKTTLCLQLADLFAQREGKEVLYIANEQEASELKAMAERLELKAKERIRIVKGMGGLRDDLGDIILRFSPCLLILDSVTKWSGDDPRVAVTICMRLKDYSVRLTAPALVINQICKSGDHHGLNQMQHAVDTTLLFYPDDEGPATRRVLYTHKNRFGPAPTQQFLEMTPRGLVPATMPSLDDEEAPESEV